MITCLFRFSTLTARDHYTAERDALLRLEADDIAPRVLALSEKHTALWSTDAGCDRTDELDLNPSKMPRHWPQSLVEAYPHFADDDGQLKKYIPKSKK